MTDRDDDLTVLQGNIVGIRQLAIGTLVTTNPGAAPRVAAAIDADGNVGGGQVTVAGDDTVLVLDPGATSDASEGAGSVADDVAEPTAGPRAATEALAGIIGGAERPSPEQLVALCATSLVPISDWVIGVKTFPGAAQVVAYALDQLGPDVVPGLVGTLAGDDLVMVLIDPTDRPLGATALHLKMLQMGA